MISRRRDSRTRADGSDQIAVFIGTKAQYIKTAPLLRLLDERGVPYRLVDSGQHASIAVGMRRELGVREPDYSFGAADDVTTIAGAVRWSAGIAARLWSPRRLREEVFGGAGGVCVVHGDTPSTLLSTLLALRAGLRVAHLEAGLRSHSILNPFPEELVRLIVMRAAHICFAPTAADEDNLQRMRRRGRIVRLDSNTSVEAVRFALDEGGSPSWSGRAIVTMHRVENLRSQSRIDGFVKAVELVNKHHPTLFVVHGPTRQVLEPSGALERLRDIGVETTPLVSHREFLRLLFDAPFALIDGGSIQEECGYLGVPTVLWREATEREHGIGRNVVLARYDQHAVERVLEDLETYRFPVQLPSTSPSQQILETLLAELPSSASQPVPISQVRFVDPSGDP